MCSRLNKFIPGWCQIVHFLIMPVIGHFKDIPIMLCKRGRNCYDKTNE